MLEYLKRTALIYGLSRLARIWGFTGYVMALSSPFVIFMSVGSAISLLLTGGLLIYFSRAAYGAVEQLEDAGQKDMLTRRHLPHV